MVPCYFLARLPPELRVKIYELILCFSAPITLRQVVPGSQSTTVLRVCRQIYVEAINVFYDVNTIAVARNDFCTETHIALKTPLKSEHVRHLFITNFVESRACYHLSRKCTVCQPAAVGLLEAMHPFSMPRLQDVLVDYQTHQEFFQTFMDSLHNQPRLSITCTAVGTYKLDVQDILAANFTFQNVPLARAWPRLLSLSERASSETDEETTLGELRQLQADVPDKLWFLICARKYRQLSIFSRSVDHKWIDAGDLKDVDLGRKHIALHTFTGVLQDFVAANKASYCRQFLRSLRELQLTGG